MTKLGTHHACGHPVNAENTYRCTLKNGTKVVKCRRCKNLKAYAQRQRLQIKQ